MAVRDLGVLNLTTDVFMCVFLVMHIVACAIDVTKIKNKFIKGLIRENAYSSVQALACTLLVLNLLQIKFEFSLGDITACVFSSCLCVCCIGYIVSMARMKRNAHR